MSKEKTLGQFTREVEALLMKRLLIGINDCLDEHQIETSYNIGETPDELVDYVKQKYNLQEAKDIL